MGNEERYLMACCALSSFPGDKDESVITLHVHPTTCIYEAIFTMVTKLILYIPYENFNTAIRLYSYMHEFNYI